MVIKNIPFHAKTMLTSGMTSGVSHVNDVSTSLLNLVFNLLHTPFQSPISPFSDQISPGWYQKNRGVMR